MNLHIKTGLGIKNYVWDLNSDVENENFLTDFSWQIWAKTTKIILSSESVKTKVHKESNSCEKCYFSISAFYKINFWLILKKLSQKIDFLHFPHFEIIAHLHMGQFPEDGNFGGFMSNFFFQAEGYCCKTNGYWRLLLICADQSWLVHG